MTREERRRTLGGLVFVSGPVVVIFVNTTTGLVTGGLMLFFGLLTLLWGWGWDEYKNMRAGISSR
jgi:hypothetical protein